MAFKYTQIWEKSGDSDAILTEAIIIKALKFFRDVN